MWESTECGFPIPHFPDVHTRRGYEGRRDKRAKMEVDLDDAFAGLPTVGDSLMGFDEGADSRLLPDDEKEEEEEASGPGDAEHDEGQEAADPLLPEGEPEAGVEDETSLPPWMHRAHASIIEARTPSTAMLGLDERLVAALGRLGVHQCFPVQAAVVPVVLAAHAARRAADVCVCAPTGSGKTLAYALPIVQALLPRVVTRLRALVLLPTRGLAAQVHGVFCTLCEGTPLRCGLAAGQEGVSWERERASLVRVSGGSSTGSYHEADLVAGEAVGEGTSAVDIVIATPGRLVEHLQSGAPFTLQHLRFLVVDEADRLLSQGYQGWLRSVLDAAHIRPSHAAPILGRSALAAPAALAAETVRARLGSAAARSRGAPLALRGADAPLLKLLFSATLTRSPAKLAPLQLVNPRYFCVAGARYATPATLKEWMLTCGAQEKPRLLLLLLRGLLEAEAQEAEAEDVAEGGRVEGEVMEGGEDGDDDDKDDDDDSAAEVTEDVRLNDEAEDAEADAALAAVGKGGGGLRRRSLKSGRVIVFCSSLESTHRLTRLLHMLGIAATEFSSSVPPKQRTLALERLKSGQTRVLIASDAMARGMDVEGVSVVINYDPPANIKGYVHRVGRTARAGKAGTSYTLLKDSEVHHFKASMAKAAKAYRPLELPAQRPALARLSAEYAHCTLVACPFA
jgi:ATP-dependent RNA helicase DDX51/DBP6